MQHQQHLDAARDAGLDIRPVDIVPPSLAHVRSEKNGWVHRSKPTTSEAKRLAAQKLVGKKKSTGKVYRTFGAVPLTGDEMLEVWNLEDEAKENDTEAKATKNAEKAAKRRSEYDRVLGLGKADADLTSDELFALISFKHEGKGTSRFTSKAKRLAEWRRLVALDAASAAAAAPAPQQGAAGSLVSVATRPTTRSGRRRR